MPDGSTEKTVDKETRECVWCSQIVSSAEMKPGNEVCEHCRVLLIGAGIPNDVVYGTDH